MGVCHTFLRPYRLVRPLHSIGWNPKSSQVRRAAVSINDLEFAYAPVRDQVRDLREYL